MTTMTAAALSGLHHLKIFVFDLEASLDWYQRVFGAPFVPPQSKERDSCLKILR